MMKRVSIGLVAGVALISLSGCAGVFGGGPAKHPRTPETPWHPPTGMLLPYAAPDGSLTRAQMEAGLRRDFAKLDTRHSGCLDDNQIRAINAERWKEDASTASPLIDFKNNGCVDFEEYAATPRSLFDLLDRKGTGKLPPGVLKPAAAKTDQAAAQTPPADDQHHRHGPPNGN